ncbi:uncharacterized protein F5Z01DRAFT_668885 [Emericellopsis atlantica]|uniref:Uncharacterized protein n=1 Tax=Emericellopsis atlantica TaxID=2614577 RepID=A0A9P8CK51_9HYPO|nr:uncharacterized protein F5Z01DRAFT_668885 [Emericellopsis atlantica]KAG9249570.1 hypothetical protein F5Z01DRAFT_668885 [Emericellopsis atlantica]
MSPQNNIITRRKNLLRKRANTAKPRTLRLGQDCNIFTVLIYYNLVREALDGVVHLPEGETLPDLNACARDIMSKQSKSMLGHRRQPRRSSRQKQRPASPRQGRDAGDRTERETGGENDGVWSVTSSPPSNARPLARQGRQGVPESLQDKNHAPTDGRAIRNGHSSQDEVHSTACDEDAEGDTTHSDGNGVLGPLAQEVQLDTQWLQDGMDLSFDFDDDFVLPVNDTIHTTSANPAAAPAAMIPQGNKSMAGWEEHDFQQSQGAASQCAPFEGTWPSLQPLSFAANTDLLSVPRKRQQKIRLLRALVNSYLHRNDKNPPNLTGSGATFSSNQSKLERNRRFKRFLGYLLQRNKEIREFDNWCQGRR